MSADARARAQLANVLAQANDPAPWSTPADVDAWAKTALHSAIQAGHRMTLREKLKLLLQMPVTS